MEIEPLPIYRSGYGSSPYSPSPSYPGPVSEEFALPLLLIRLMVLAIAPFILVDAALYQLEMLATGGRTPVTPALLKVGLLAAFTAAFLLRGRIRSQPALKTAFVLVVYLIFAALHQYFDLGIDVAGILISYNSYYLLLLLGVCALSTPVRVSDRTLAGLSIMLALICGALGVAQYITNSPIVRTYSSDGYFKVLVWSSFGRIRVFSLFVEPAACAVFFCFIASLAIAMSARTRNLVLAIPLLSLSLFLSWATGARTNMAGTVCGVLAACIFTFRRARDRTRWLPLVWLSVGIMMALYAYAQTTEGGLSTGLMTDASSFADRLALWSSILEMFRSTSPLNFLLGYGLVQNPAVDPVLGGSDNLYLATILHIGLVGLCLVMLLLWRLWEVVRKEAETRTSPLTIAVAATYSTILMNGLFKLGSFGMIFIFFAICDKSSPHRPINSEGFVGGKQWNTEARASAEWS